MVQSLKAPRTQGLMAHGSSQPPVTVVPGSLTPLLAPQALNTHDTQTHNRQNTLIHKLKREDVLETAHSTVRLSYSRLESCFFAVPSCSCSVLSIRPFPVLRSPWSRRHRACSSSRGGTIVSVCLSGNAVCRGGVVAEAGAPG